MKNVSKNKSVCISIFVACIYDLMLLLPYGKNGTLELTLGIVQLLHYFNRVMPISFILWPKLYQKCLLIRPNTSLSPGMLRFMKLYVRPLYCMLSLLVAPVLLEEKKTLGCLL